MNKVLSQVLPLCLWRFHYPLRAIGSVVGCAALLVMVHACHSYESCYGIETGDKFTIEIIDTYDDGSSQYANSKPTNQCAFSFDLTKELILTATVVRNFDDGLTCASAVPAYESFNGWSWSNPDNVDGSGPQLFLEGNYNASNGRCHGVVAVTLYVNDGDPFSDSVSGQTPQVTLDRFYRGDSSSSPDCPLACHDDYVVRVKRAS